VEAIHPCNLSIEIIEGEFMVELIREYNTKIKICGICNMTDAQLAIKYGAHYLGLIFVQSSPRYVDPALAQSIVDSCNREQIKVVGVFQNSSTEEMENIAHSVGLDYFQLHGNESPALCSILSRPVIKTLQIANKSLAEQACTTFSLGTVDPNRDIDHCLALLEQYRPYCHHFLFDKSKDSQTSDWLASVSAELQLIEHELGEYFFAGGLNINNIEIVLQKLKPAVVDISSGVEKMVRIKSETLLADFCTKILAPHIEPLSL
jgi:phosphoribosylanthranilate isomerase